MAFAVEMTRPRRIEGSTIRCEKLHFRYEKDYVLESFSYTFAQGITLLKGYSGCGKSTLLKLIAGYLRPEEGTIVLPHPWLRPNVNFQRQGLGFVFQQLNLLPLASIERNLDIVGSIAGLPRAVTRQRTDELFKQLGLEILRNKKPGVLSGGQQQRAAIARALIKMPAVLLLDEPTSGLDDANTQVIKNLLISALPEQCICLISTHDQRLEEISNEIIDFNHYLPVERHLEALA